MKPNYVIWLTIHSFIPDDVRQLQQISTQIGENCHLQLGAADLLSQTQVGQTVIWPEFIS